MSKKSKITSTIAAVIASLIMLQTLYFKFSAAPESIYIFTTLNLEPYGRIGVGILELIASILLLIPRSRVIGSILGLGLMGGAIFSHFTKLGIIVMNDGGYLFFLCITVLSMCLICLIIERKKAILLLKSIVLRKK
ncbi:hypothetical protein BH10BAC1_BH10BAC1_15560 [soil metagenome]